MWDGTANDGQGACVHDCGEHGKWTVDKCVCDLGFGVVQDKCEAHPCDEGMIWNDETGVCQPDCDMHAKWVDGACKCDRGYKLTDGHCVANLV